MVAGELDDHAVRIERIDRAAVAVVEHEGLRLLVTGRGEALLDPGLRGRVDLVITSPPYANRMSYVRELRPYMYWLGFLASGRAAGELDWTAIGGTWGIATSRLADWTRDARRFDDAALDAAVARIAAHDARSGPLLANYVTKYADDVWRHLQSLRAVLSPGAAVHYVVGNSTFYGVLLPVERLYVTMLERLGFTGVACRPIRKRNSKKALVEFDVSARWP